ncbi:hypothetical protein [Buchnera aphidicola]|uniref:hypothetical protein n=1 Tax=Buchnera aphidicola TaxID=9 RepID=UPI0012AC0276|nr:hypothetical protein [Buchnera aphidicola]
MNIFIDIKVIGNSLNWAGNQLLIDNYLSSSVVASCHHHSIERDFIYTVTRDFNNLEDPIFIG